jgi:hypothetical protein
MIHCIFITKHYSTVEALVISIVTKAFVVDKSWEPSLSNLPTYYTNVELKLLLFAQKSQFYLRFLNNLGNTPPTFFI